MATISELRARLAGGELTARRLTEYYLNRIEYYDPSVHAVIELNPDALASADELDRQRQHRQPLGQLYGIPLLLKDNIDTADQMLTTAGSLALQDSRPAEDAFIVAKLRKAGAIILGKTNLSEWANFRSTRSSSGWSSRGGQTRNPYALDRTPGGSSSGSGVAVAAEFCAAAIGTETDGSIVHPSAANSVVGFKPTVGLVSRSGIIPISQSQDTAGPITRSVSDAALLLTVLSGIDEQDVATVDGHKQTGIDYRRYLAQEGLRGARLGLLRQYCDYGDKVLAVLEQALAVLRGQGAEIVDNVALPQVEAMRKSEAEVLSYEFKTGLNTYLRRRGTDWNLQKIIQFNQREHARVMPYFGQERMLSAQQKGALDEADYQHHWQRSRLLAREQGIDNALTAHKLDALIALTAGPPWLIDWVNGDCRGGSCAAPAAVAGYPHITVPAGYVQGLPVGLSFFAAAFQEPVLLRLAYAYEQASQLRQPPQFLASAQV